MVFQESRLALLVYTETRRNSPTERHKEIEATTSFERQYLHQLQDKKKECVTSARRVDQVHQYKNL
jgi:RNase adaptor protein for sRNA GlmZ degradation